MIIRYVLRKILLPIGVIAVAGALIAGSLLSHAPGEDQEEDSSPATVSAYVEEQGNLPIGDPSTCRRIAQS